MEIAIYGWAQQPRINRVIVRTYNGDYATYFWPDSLTTMTAISDFQAAMASAASYVSSGDYDAARRQIILARIYLAQIPNSTADGVSAQWREDLASIEQSVNMESGRTTRSVSASCEFQS